MMTARRGVREGENIEGRVVTGNPVSEGRVGHDFAVQHSPYVPETEPRGPDAPDASGPLHFRPNEVVSLWSNDAGPVPVRGSGDVAVGGDIVLAGAVPA